MTGGSLVHGYQVGHKYATRSKGSKAYQKFLIGASHTTLASVFLWVFVLSLHSMYPGKHPSMVHFMRKKRRVLSSAGFHCIQESQTLPNTQTSLLFILWQCPMVHFQCVQLSAQPFEFRIVTCHITVHVEQIFDCLCIQTLLHVYVSTLYVCVVCDQLYSLPCGQSV